MCRMALYLGPPMAIGRLVVEPDHSILKQSFAAREREEPLNGDGFGIGWYVPDVSPEPALYRSALPAWNDPNLLNLARVTVSSCILAHVRAASPGLPVTVFNCHPFVHGRFAFMHNGAVGDFRRLQRRIQAVLSDDAYFSIRGSTDSEHLFGVMLDFLAETPPRDDASDHLARALDAGITTLEEVAARDGLEEPSYLNVALTDGRCAVVTRYATNDYAAASLYLHRGKAYTCSGGVCRMIDPGQDEGAVLVCSEPLSGDPGWEQVPAQHMVVIREDRSVEVRPMQAASVRSLA